MLAMQGLFKTTRATFCYIFRVTYYCSKIFACVCRPPSPAVVSDVPPHLISEYQVS
jgi:hypothetical protein